MVKSRDSVGIPASSPWRGQQSGNRVMTCGLRSHVAGAKSRQSGDTELIIGTGSMALQYESQKATHREKSAFYPLWIVVVVLVFLGKA